MAKGLYVSPTQFVPFGNGKKNLQAELVTRQNVAFGDAGFLGTLPNPDPILKSLGKDIATYRDLRSDALVGGCIRRRKSAVKGLERGLDKGNSADNVMAFVEDVLSGWDIDRIIGELLEALFYGYQPAELNWGKDGSHYVVDDIVSKPPEWFSFDDGNQLRFRSRHAGLAGELLPPRKFIVATQDATYDNPYGFPDLSMCFWPVAFKKGGWKFWVRFAEKYGSPWAIGKHPRSASQGEIEVLLDSLGSMVEDAVAAIPDDSSVTILEAAGKDSSSNIYKEMIVQARAEIAMALLGQNQTTESTANKASATAGLDVTADIRDGDASIAMSAINQVIRWLVELNFGDVDCPVWTLWEQDTIDETQAKRDLTLSQTRGFFTDQYFQREYGLQSGDLQPFTAITMGALTPRTAAFAEAAADHDLNAQDQLDRALDSLMKNGTLDAVLQPVLAPLFAAVKKGVSPTELMGQLAELYPQMDGDPLTEKLARVLFVAKIWGRLHGNVQWQ